MATLFIAEFVGAGALKPGFPCETPLAEQTIAVGGGSVQSATLNSKTTAVRVTSDVVCSIAVGSAAVATTAKRRLAANAPEWLAVPEASGFKIAAIANT